MQLIFYFNNGIMHYWDISRLQQAYKWRDRH